MCHKRRKQIASFCEMSKMIEIHKEKSRVSQTRRVSTTALMKAVPCLVACYIVKVYLPLLLHPMDDVCILK